MAFGSWSRPVREWKDLPLIIPVLIYNGREPWNMPTDLGSMIGHLDPSAEIYRPQLRFKLVDESAFPREVLAALDSPVAGLFRIDRSRDWSEVRTSVHRLRRTLPPAEDSLRRAFEIWLRKVILPRFGWAEEEASAALTLEELETMLAESIDRWNLEIREEGRKEGRQEGRKEGRKEGESLLLLRQLRLKFGPLDSATEERVLAADTDQLLEWGGRILTAERIQDVFVVATPGRIT